MRPWYTFLTLWSHFLTTLATPRVRVQDAWYTFLRLWSHFLTTLAAPLCATRPRSTFFDTLVTLFDHFGSPLCTTRTRGTLFDTLVTLFDHFGRPPVRYHDPWHTFLTLWSHFFCRSQNVLPSAFLTLFEHFLEIGAITEIGGVGPLQTYPPEPAFRHSNCTYS